MKWNVRSFSAVLVARASITEWGRYRIEARYKHLSFIHVASFWFGVLAFFGWHWDKARFVLAPANVMPSNERDANETCPVSDIFYLWIRWEPINWIFLPYRVHFLSFFLSLTHTLTFLILHLVHLIGTCERASASAISFRSLQLSSNEKSPV